MVYQNAIRKFKKITNINIVLAMSVTYYLLPTISSIFGLMVFDPNNFINRFPFIVTWLFPSLVLLVLHILYCINLNKFNSNLEENKLEM